MSLKRRACILVGFVTTCAISVPDTTFSDQVATGRWFLSPPIKLTSTM